MKQAAHGFSIVVAAAREVGDRIAARLGKFIFGIECLSDAGRRLIRECATAVALPIDRMTA